jgi:copper resistance protein D
VSGLETALAAVRFVQFAAAMVLLGAPVFALGLQFRCPGFAAAERDFATWLRRVLIAAAITALVSALLWLDLEAAAMGGGWSEAFDRDTLATVLFETLFGHAWLWHLALEAALLAVLLAWRGTSALVLVALLAAAHAASLAWAGHAVMHPGAAPLAAQVLHLLAGGLWLGSLPALYHLLARAHSAPSPALDHAVRTLLPLYSRVGYAVVSVLVLSGIGNSIFLVGSTGALVATPYGRVLLAKIALVLATIAVALDNRLTQTPRILDRDPAAVASLARHVALEQGLALLVLAAVSVLGLLPPALQQ